MRTIIQTAIFSILTLCISAQDYTMTPEVFLYDMNATDSKKIGYTLTNSSSADLAWYWDVTLPDDFPKSWDIQVCDQVTCWAENILVRPTNALENILAPAEATVPVLHYVEVKPNGEAGSAEIQFCIYDNPNFTDAIVCSSFSTSVDENGDLTITKIFPNPASNYLELDSNLNRDKLQGLSISSTNGGLVQLLDKNSIAKNENRIDISNLSPGVYLLNILTEDGPITQKFVKL